MTDDELRKKLRRSFTRSIYACLFAMGFGLAVLYGNIRLHHRALAVLNLITVIALAYIVVRATVERRRLGRPDNP